LKVSRAINPLEVPAQILVNIDGHYNCTLENYTLIGDQYLPHAEELTRKGETSR